jgi:uncharacterized membrane protein
MPIEFRCTQCQRLLRTADGTEGKQAKCPECGMILTIPGPAPPSPVGPPPPGVGGGIPAGPPPPGAGSPSPFAPGFPPPGGAAPVENPYVSPAAYAAGAPPLAAGPLPAIQPTQVDVGDVLGRTWTIFKEQWGMCLALVFVAWAINMGVSFVAGMIPILGPLVSGVFSIWIGIGVALGVLKIARGQEAMVGDLFTGWPYFWPILGASLLVGLMVLGVFAIFFGPTLAGVLVALQDADEGLQIGTAVVLGLLCAIPATVVSLMFSQYYYLILDRQEGVMDSLSLSKQIMAGNKMTLFLVNLVVAVVGIPLVLLTCGLGLLAVAPFVALIRPVFYLMVTGQSTADQILRPPAWPYGPGPTAPPPGPQAGGPGPQSS